MGRVIALTGFMGSGKSSAGRALAEKLGWDFADLDDLVEARTLASVARIFTEQGESGFRRLELAALESLLPSSKDLVLALGGGTLTMPRARELVEQHAFLVYLDVDADTCWGRSQTEGADSRPLARERSSFEELEEKRRPLYLSAADLIIDGCGPAREVPQRILRSLPPELLGEQRSSQTEPGDQPGTPRSGWSLELTGTSRPSLITGGPGSRRGLEEYAREAAGDAKRAWIISDRQVWQTWGEEVNALLGPLTRGREAFTVEPGEASKTLEAAGQAWQWLAEEGMRRDDLLVALGGGVVGDLAGFVAACYMRGTRFWQLPTSLLAMVDSSVGGKVAINLPAGKNLVGSFYQPELVVIDTDFLSTLAPYEMVNGLGEVVKYALLVGDGLFERLEDTAALLLKKDSATTALVVEQCVRYKASIVEADEREQGQRAVLNLGHTFAHALEASLGYGNLAHGRAVALGLLVSLRVSEILLGLDPEVRQRAARLIERLELPSRYVLPSNELLQRMAGRDKKVDSRGSCFVGLRSLGEPVWGMDVPWGVLEEALEVVRR